MRDKVLVYEDYGCASTENLKKALCGYYEKKGINVISTDAADIIYNNALNESVEVLVIPGGAATPYRQKLKVLGNQKIIDYIKCGGAYLGICAGAYYACSKVEFEKDIPEIAIQRDNGLLGLVNATAIGTLRKELKIRPYSANAGSSAVVDLLWIQNGKTYSSYYHGGPWFKIDNTNEDVEILAVYKNIMDTPPAIVGKKLGKGKIVLSGVHIEDRGDDLLKVIHSLRIDVDEAISVAQILKEKEEKRQMLFNKVIASLERK